MPDSNTEQKLWASVAIDAQLWPSDSRWPGAVLAPFSWKCTTFKNTFPPSSFSCAISAALGKATTVSALVDQTTSQF